MAWHCEDHPAQGRTVCYCALGCGIETPGLLLVRLYLIPGMVQSGMVSLCCLTPLARCGIVSYGTVCRRISVSVLYSCIYGTAYDIVLTVFASGHGSRPYEAALVRSWLVSQSPHGKLTMEFYH